MPTTRSGFLTFGWAITLFLVFAAGQARAQARAPKQTDLYRLRAGDQLAISVTPQKMYDCGGVILSDGMLYLKNVGGFRAVDLTIPELEEHVRKALSEKLVAPRVSATIVQIAPATAAPNGVVTIIGAVARAGALPLDDGLRLYKALELVGGPAKGADLTRVGIRHRDLSRTVVDLSSADRISDPAHNRLLKDGDSVEVPSLPVRTVSFRGAVVRPGPLDLQGEFRIWKALDLVGGPTREADLATVSIIHADLTRTVVDLSTPEKLADPKQNLTLREGDSVEIPLLAVAPDPDERKDQVRIRGNVLNPGRYPYRPGMELIDLIEAAGKLKPSADVTRIQLQRGKQVEAVNLEVREKQGFEGKVILQRDDEVFIPEQEHRIIILGASPKTGPVTFKPGQTLRALFTEGGTEVAGAVNPATANLKKVQILRRGRQPMEVNLHDLILKRQSTKRPDIALETGDVIFIPPRQQRGGSRGLLGFLSQLGPLGFLFSVL